MTEEEGEKKEDNINKSSDDNNDINDNINNNDENSKNEPKKKNNKKKKKEFNNGDNDKDNNDNDNNKNNFEEKKDKNDKDNKYDDNDANNKTNEEVNKSKDSEKSKSKNIDSFLLSSLYDLFEGYDEIVIKPNNDNQYVIKGCLKIDEDKEIKFEINYDKERDFFDYYPNNTNFNFENEDEPFNWDLDILKEDFSLLIKNFKKYKNK